MTETKIRKKKNNKKIHSRRGPGRLPAPPQVPRRWRREEVLAVSLATSGKENARRLVSLGFTARRAGREEKRKGEDLEEGERKEGKRGGVRKGGRGGCKQYGWYASHLCPGSSLPVASSSLSGQSV